MLVLRQNVVTPANNAGLFFPRPRTLHSAPPQPTTVDRCVAVWHDCDHPHHLGPGHHATHNIRRHCRQEQQDRLCSTMQVCGCVLLGCWGVRVVLGCSVPVVGLIWLNERARSLSRASQMPALCCRVLHACSNSPQLTSPWQFGSRIKHLALQLNPAPTHTHTLSLKPSTHQQDQQVPARDP